MTSRARPLLPGFAAICVALSAFSGGVRAANVEKDVLTTATDLTLGASYSGGGTPGATWDATFKSAVYGATTFTVNASLTLGTLNDLDATQSLVITDNGAANATLTLSGGGDTVAGSAAADLIFLAANGSLTIQNGAKTLGLALGVDGNFDTAAGAALTISSAITGNNFSLTKTGSGMLTLSGANSFGGGGKTFTLSGGTLNINSAAALGNTGNTFVINGATTIDNTSGAAITTGNYGVAINGDFTFAGGGTGTAHDLNLGTGNVTLGTATGTSRSFKLTAANSTLTIGGVIANGTTANSLIKSGAGTLLLAGKNIYTGATTVNLGTLRAGSAQAFGVNSAVTVNYGGVLDLGGNSNTIGSLAGAAGGGVQSSGGAATLTTGGLNTSTAFAGTLQDGTGPFSLAQNGAGTLTLSGTNTYTGTTTVGAGVLLAGSAQAFGNNSAVTVNAGGTLDLGGNSNTIGSLAGAAGAIVQSSGGAAALTTGGLNTGTTYSGVLQNGSGTLSLSKSGTGILILSGSVANTYTGMTTVNTGELDLNKTAGIPAIGGNLTIGDGVGGANADIVKLLATGQISGTTAVLIHGGSGSLNLNSNSQTIGSLADTGTVVVNGSSVNLGNATLTVGDGNNTTFSGAITGNGGNLTKQGTGTLTLGGTATANTFAGLTTVNVGELDLNKTAGTLAIGGNLTIGNGSGGANSDIVKLLASNQILPTAAVLINGSTGKLDLNNNNQTIGSLADTGTVTANASSVGLGSGTLTVGNNNNTTFSGAITGAGGSLIKQGNGTLTLAGTNSYTGATTVNAGTLFAGSTQALGTNSAVTVGASGKLDLGGKSTMIGSLTGAAGGIVQSSLGAGTLTLGGLNTSTVFAGVLQDGTGPLSLVKNGTGTLTLSGTNTYSGSTTINGGTLLAGSTQAFGTNSAVTLSASGMLDLGGNSNTIGSLTGPAGGIVQSSLGAGTLTTGALNTSTVFAGSLQNGTGSLSLVKTGTGNLTVSGNSTYSGSTTLLTGTLTIGSDTAIGTGTLLFNGGTLAATGGARTLANAAQFNTRNLAFNSTSDLTLNGPITENTSIRMTVGNTGVLTLNGVVSGSGRYLRKLGTGTMVLNGANTFTGGLDIRAGTTIVGNNAAAGTGTLTLRGGALQAGGAARTLANAVTLSANTTIGGAYDLTFSGATSLSTAATLSVQNPNTTFSGNISGGGGSVVSKAGSGTLILSGAGSNFSGGVTILSGIVILDSNNAAGTGTITVGDVLTTSTSPATLLFSATAGRTVSNAINVPVGGTGLRTIGGLNTTGVNTLGGAMTLGTGVTLTEGAGGEVNFTGAISGAGGITKTGAGTIRLSNPSTNTPNSFSGPTLVSAGTLAYGANNALGSGTVTINGGTLDMGANRTDTVGTVTLQNGSILGTGTSTLTSTSGFAVQNGAVSAILAGAVNLTKDTAGTVTLSGVNTYTGSTNVNAGTLSYGASNVLPGGALNINGGTLDMGTGRTDTVGAVTLASGSILGGAGSVLTSTSGFTLQSGTVTTALGGAVAVTKNTTGTALISGANIYTGATNITAGTLRLGATETLPNGSALTISAGGTLDMNNLSDTVGSLAGAGNLLVGSGMLTSGGDNTSTSFTGTIGGSGGITKTGLGTLTLGGTDSYGGATNVNAGTLALGSGGAGPSASRVTVASGATFNVAGFTSSIGSLAGAGSVTLGSGTLTAGVDNTSSTFSGNILGTGNVNKTGSGTFTMTGVNAFIGDLKASAGSVVLSGATGTALGATSFTVLTGASLVLDNSAGDNPNRIGPAAAINIQGGNLTLISGPNGTVETTGQLNFLAGPSNITVVHNGSAAQSSALTFTSLGGTILGTSLNFAGTGGTLGSGPNGPHIYITAQPGGLLGGWATVGNDFAAYSTYGVCAYSGYYTDALGININDPAKIVKLTGSSQVGAWTLTNAGTTTDGGLQINDLALVDLNTDPTRTLNLVGGGLVKASAPDTIISGAGRLTAGGTAAGSLYISVDTGRMLSIPSRIINNAGSDGIYGNADDGSVSIVKSGAGMLVLGGANAFTGGLYVNAGTVSAGADSNLGAGASGVFLSGGTLSITNGFTASAGRRFVLTSGLTSTIAVASGQSLTLTGASDLLATGSSTSQLIKTGAGDLVLGGANPNFTGIVQVSSGAVELRNAASIGTGAIALAGGTLRLRADTSTAFSNPFSLLTDSTIAGSTLTTGTPVLSLGAVTIGAQNLSLSATGGAILSLAGANLTAAGATFNTTAGITRLGAVNGAFGFTKTGAGILELTSPAAYSGTTDVQGGTLRLANATAIPVASTVNVSASATVDLNNLPANFGSITGTGAITLGSGTLTVGGDLASSAFGGVISGSGGLTTTGNETLTLSGANTYTGTTNITAGSIQLAASNSLPGVTSVAISSGAKLDLAGYSQTVAALTGSGTVALGTGALTVGDATNTTFAGDFTGSGNVTKVGTGTLSLSGNSTFTGGLTVSTGTLAVLADTALGDRTGTTSVATGAQIVLSPGVTIVAEPLTIAGSGSAGAGVLRVDSGAATWAGSISLSADASLGAATGAALTLGGAIGLSGKTLTFTGAGLNDVSGTITGTGGLVQSGSGVLVLSSVNNFSGPTTIASGTISLTSNDALGVAGSGNQTQILNGATLAFNDAVGVNIHDEKLLIAGNGVGGAGAIQSVSGDNEASGPVTLTADTAVNIAAGSTLSMVGGIGQSMAGTNFTKNGSGTLVLGGTSTFTGTLAVTDGTLQIASDYTLNGNPGVSLSATATLDLNDFSDSLGSLSGSGTITFGTDLAGGGELTVGANGASTTFDGIITGVGDFEKTGSGSLTLTSANTYTGKTTLTGGTLVAGNDLAFGPVSATQTIIFNGGGLASNNDARVIAYPIVVSPVAGNTITGSNSMTLTGPVTSGGAGSVLNINLTNPTKTVTVNPTTAGTFDPGTIQLSSGTLLFGSANNIPATTNVRMNGGTLNTGGYSDNLGAMILAADSTLDFGTSNNVRLQFSSASWTGGTLNVINWTGTAFVGNNPDQFLIGSGPVGADFLNHISFQGYGTGAIAFDRGGGLYEIVPLPEPATMFGAVTLVAFIGYRERRTVQRWLARGRSRGK